MMSRIGNKKGLRGFSLIEAMAATAVLSLGIVFIYQGFFSALNSYEYYRTYLYVLPLAEERLFQAQSSLTHPQEGPQMAAQGEFVNGSAIFNWAITYDDLEQVNDLTLYKINLLVKWRKGPKTYKFTRNAYAIQKENR